MEVFRVEVIREALWEAFTSIMKSTTGAVEARTQAYFRTLVRRSELRRDEDPKPEGFQEFLSTIEACMAPLRAQPIATPGLVVPGRSQQRVVQVPMPMPGMDRPHQQGPIENLEEVVEYCDYHELQETLRRMRQEKIVVKTIYLTQNAPGHKEPTAEWAVIGVRQVGQGPVV